MGSKGKPAPNDMPTPPDFLASWNQEEDLLNFFLNSGEGTGLTPPLPSFSSGGTPGSQGPSPSTRAYQGPPAQAMPPPGGGSGVFQSIHNYTGEEEEDSEIPLTTPMQQHYYKGAPSGPPSSNPNIKPNAMNRRSSPLVIGGQVPVQGHHQGQVNAMVEGELVPTPPTFVDGMPVLGEEQVINHLTLPHHHRKQGGPAQPGQYQQPMVPQHQPQGGGQYLSASLPHMGDVAPGGVMWQGPGSAPMYPGGYMGGLPDGAGGGYGGMEPPVSTEGGKGAGGRGTGGMTQEERRARRLARNRESARQSRRRKKEYLQLLGSKVKMLNDGIETERRERLDESEERLGEIGRMWRNELERGGGGKELKEWFDNTSPGCEERNIATEFQWRQASQAVLPGHRKFLVWLNGRSDLFFKKNKAVHNERVSSKQLGERLTNEGKGGKCKGEERFWPLFCYDMSFSYDQEERLVAAIKQRLSPLHAEKLSEADRVVDTMGTAIKLGMGREERTLEDILFNIMTEEQAAKWVVWQGMHKERLKRLFGKEGFNEDIEKIVRGEGAQIESQGGGRGSVEAGVDLELVKAEIKILREIGDKLEIS